MALLDYGIEKRLYGMNSVIHEGPSNSRWFKKARKMTPRNPTLEKEIFELRSKMEQAYKMSHSLTSENVVESSKLLDNKINEYMKWIEKFSD